MEGSSCERFPHPNTSLLQYGRPSKLWCTLGAKKETYYLLLSPGPPTYCSVLLVYLDLSGQ